MDPPAIACALCVVLAGWWFTGRETIKEVAQLPVQCHCACNTPEVREHPCYLWGLLVIIALLSLLCTVLGILLILGRERSWEAGTPLALKGVTGKGRYGASTRLQILEN